MPTKIDPTLNFWEEFPTFKSLKHFKEFYKANDKEESSLVMWCIAMCYHPESPLWGMREEDRIEEAAMAIFPNGVKDYKNMEEEINFLSDKYSKIVLTPIDRQLLTWNKKLDEKTEFLENTKYTADTAEMIDKLLANNTKLYKDLERILDERQRKLAEAQGLGGAVASESDKGEL